MKRSLALFALLAFSSPSPASPVGAIQACDQLTSRNFDTVIFSKHLSPPPLRDRWVAGVCDVSARCRTILEADADRLLTVQWQDDGSLHVLTDAPISNKSQSTSSVPEDPAVTVKVFSMSDTSVIDPDNKIMRFDETKCSNKRPFVRVKPSI